MALANQVVVSDGTLEYIDVGILYFEQDDIEVYLDLSTDPLVRGTDYTWTSQNRITFSYPIVPAGTVVTLRRATKLDAMYNLYDGGAPFNRYTVDENFRQLLFRTQEFSEGLGFSGIQQNLDMNDYRILNLGNAEDPKDAVPYGQMTAYVQQFVGAGEAALEVAQEALEVAQAASDKVDAAVIESAAQLRDDLADPAKGARLVQYGSITVQDALASNALGIASLNTGLANVVASVNDANARIDDVEDALDAQIAVAQHGARVPSTPVQIDQFIDAMSGRGMLTAETNNVSTTTSVIGSALAGTSSITLATTTNLLVGGSLVIRHTNGEYWPYFIYVKTGNTLAVLPALRFNVDSSCEAERLWYNRAHPGKFYMRYLAQRVARGTEAECAMVQGRRAAFVDYGQGTTVALGGLTAGGTGVTVNYYPANPLGPSGNTDTPVRFTFETTGYLDMTAGSTGYAQTGLFTLQAYCRVQAILTMASDTAVTVAVLDQSDRVLSTMVVAGSGGAANAVMQHKRVRMCFFTGAATSVRFRFSRGAGVAVGMALASIDCFEQPIDHGRIVSKRNAVIVGLGDSWIAGDVVNTPERESIMTQLALELPQATIINAGIGGNKVDQMLARFNADVAVHRPDYVIVNTGTNEAYNPYASTFVPTAVGHFIALYLQLIARILSIGARPILLGVPALAQSDPEVPALGEWELLNRSKLMYILMQRALSNKPNAT